jgi:hypothetical protein
MSLQELELTARKVWSVAVEMQAITILAYGFFLVGIPQVSAERRRLKKNKGQVRLTLIC